MTFRPALAAAAMLACACHAAYAADFDRRLNEANAGPFWQHGNLVVNTAVASAVAGALWLGAEDRLGRTLWQSSEAWAVSAAVTEVLKVAAGRVRPTETQDPGKWFAGGRSFPSGHTTAAASVVTPLILEYKDDHPMVWLLAAIPAYEMVSRVKTHSHWQSDVIAGAAIGAATGYLEHQRGPWVVKALPRGVYVGFRKAF
ncbi:hypothetical protein GCM10027277_12870 [Pseudoduganella ginsengisoli]|nr:phosphatase PAP2 family protein [Pseudoduganella ginsengisoli]